MVEKTRSRASRRSRKKRAALGFPRFLRYWYFRLTRLQGHPIEIARGLAVGVFSGFFPWFGLQIAIAIFLAIVVRGNKLAAAAATWISNPLTDVPIFLFNYKVGELILGRWNPERDRTIFQSSDSWLEHWTSLGGEALRTLLFGCLASGTICALVTYFASLHLLSRARDSRRSR
ncbi:DUF2062 domain-containing protein [Pannus brasiliensis CCIBt3594]|uniref:DUF2062 domain-containing protein n=1 Tax=Pannus brasiliensis CCIBt3594 TaxID=1427578 RepID=A0AAW9QSV1_9CHRO